MQVRDLPAPGLPRAPLQGLAQEPVGERPAQLAPSGEARVQQVEDELAPGAHLGDVAHRSPLVVVDGPAEGGRELERRPIVLPVGGGEDPLHRGHPHGVDVVRDQPRFALGELEPRASGRQNPALDPVAHEVHGEQGVPGRAPRDLGGEGTGQVEEPLDQLLAILAGQGPDGHPLRAGVPQRALDEVGGRGGFDREDQGVRAQGGHHQDRRRLHALPVEQVHGELDGVVPPLDVVQEQDHGQARGLPLQDPAHEDVSLSGGGERDSGGAGGSLVLGSGGHQLGEGAHLVQLVDPVPRQQSGDAIRRLHAVQACRPQGALDHRGEPVAGAGDVGVGRLEDRHRPQLVRALSDPLHQPALAQSGAALEQDHAGGPVPTGLSQGPPDLVALGLPPDEGHGAQPVQRQPGAHEVHVPVRAVRTTPGAGQRARRLPGGVRHHDRFGMLDGLVGLALKILDTNDACVINE